MSAAFKPLDRLYASAIRPQNEINPIQKARATAILTFAEAENKKIGLVHKLLVAI